MTTTLPRNAADAPIRFGVAACSLGWVSVAATARGLCAIDLGDTPAELEAGLRARFPHAAPAHDPEFAGWMQHVVDFFEAPAQGCSLPLDLQGTAFQRRVWAALCQIPAGSTLSYTEVAARIGAPAAVRAVAGACAALTRRPNRVDLLPGLPHFEPLHRLTDLRMPVIFLCNCTLVVQFYNFVCGFYAGLCRT